VPKEKRLKATINPKDAVLLFSMLNGILTKKIMDKMLFKYTWQQTEVCIF
jgi:hypothetical protein